MSRILPAPIIRRPKSGPPPPIKSSWLTSFADMITLVLTFLVLLISITTLDPHTDLSVPEGELTEPAEEVLRGSGVLLYSNRGLMAPVVEMVENLDNLPPDMMFDPEEVKNAIFQLDPAKATEYEQLQEAIDDRIKISRDSRGLVIQWDRSLLFPEGGTIMYEDNLVLLRPWPSSWRI